MRATDQSLGEQLHITPRDIVRRKALYDITPADELAMSQRKADLEAVLPEVVETFYKNQVETPEIEQLIGDAETLARLRRHMVGYLQSLFGGAYDEFYVLLRLRVGMVHNRIGVPPKLYIASMRTLHSLLRSRLTGEGMSNGEPGECNLCQPFLTALEKLMAFDLSLVMDTYIHALVGQVERGRRELAEYAQGLEEEVARRTRQLSELALTDPLTGLANRRALFEALRRELASALRQERPLTVLMLDLDGFKGVNDRHGHEEGDRVLELAATALRQALRASDLPVRMGGDEFAALLPGADLPTAREVGQRLFAAFDGLRGPHAVTMSVGVASFSPAHPQEPEALLRQADEAMYRAKKRPGHALEG